MKLNEIFNVTVCSLGIAILLIHFFNLVFKKNKRKDEVRLLIFLIFTIIHFAVYLSFTFLKINFASNEFIIGFYTTFYIFNNIEVLLFVFYAISFVSLMEKKKKILAILNCSIFVVFVILDIVNAFTGIFFSASGGEYVRSNTMIISQGYQFIMFVLVFVFTIFNKKLIIREKIAFALYCLLPLVAILLQNAYKGYAIAYASVIISIEILFFFVNVSKNIQLAQEQEKNKDAQIKVMMSQIQPHFVYNSLSAISTLITVDPEGAQKALDNFTEYLRHNLSSLTAPKLIPFEEELRHIETYVALEKVRFKERVSVIYDIRVKDFSVPPLSIQPIVENAIKHGILKNIEGGVLSIKTYERADAYVVEVIDDGVGFDMESVDFDSNTHFGINNIKYRLKTMCNGDLEITSKVDYGTKAVITFYK